VLVQFGVVLAALLAANRWMIGHTLPHVGGRPPER
jgi:hypothetical protein